MHHLPNSCICINHLGPSFSLSLSLIFSQIQYCTSKNPSLPPMLISSLPSSYIPCGTTISNQNFSSTICNGFLHLTPYSSIDPFPPPVSLTLLPFLFTVPLYTFALYHYPTIYHSFSIKQCQSIINFFSAFSIQPYSTLATTLLVFFH